MRRTLVLALALAVFACAQEAPDEQAMDFIFYGGTIVTRSAQTPQVEAVAVKDGRVADMGTFEAMHDTHAGALTRMIDLDGATMLPGAADSTQAADVGSMMAALASGATETPAIAVGSAADFLVFNRNPLETAQTGAEDLRVVRIIRGGETIYRAGH
jgi:predicted amidohydrolase YtcJ